MNCPNCNAEFSGESGFCEICEARLEIETHSVSPPASDEAPHSFGELLHGADGVWRWTYEFSLWKNPTVLITVIQVVLLASLAPVLVSGVITLFESGWWESLRVMGMILGIVLGILLVLASVGYVAVALINGGKYCVVFEMDDDGVKHLQMQKQFRKSQVLAILTVLAGAAAGNPQAMGAGLLAGSRKSSYSRFSKVKSIVLHPRRGVIHVNEAFNKNQIYAPAEFYETIQQHILSRCPRAKVVRR